MCRPKHRNDHNHSKCGFVGGNPRYSKKDRRDNRVELVAEEPDMDLYYHLLELEEYYFNAEFGCYDYDDDIRLDHDDLDDLDDHEDSSCYEDDDLSFDLMMSFGRNSIEEGGMSYEDWD
jgi:hypothetical protein